MFAQYIQLNTLDWNILVYYNVTPDDFVEIEDALELLDCPKSYIKKAFEVLSSSKNTGFTFTESDYKMSVVCIAETTSASLFVNTAAHEIKHVQSHICAYYDIDESSEEAAYLTGYIFGRMYQMLVKVLKHYVRFIGR